MQTRSFKFAIEKSMKTMTEAQEKNHTDPVDLSSRTPLRQMMQRAVMYTHQVGADRSTAPLASRKKNLVIFGPPIVFMYLVSEAKHCTLILLFTLFRANYCLHVFI